MEELGHRPTATGARDEPARSPTISLNFAPQFKILSWSTRRGFRGRVYSGGEPPVLIKPQICRLIVRWREDPIWRLWLPASVASRW
jgi:hypothetical protein